ncbi:MAG: hypothetical protein ACE149_19790 [Armatimonadota bacterium]
MATAIQSATPTSRRSWGSVGRSETTPGIIPFVRPAVNGPVEVIVRKPRRAGVDWSLWWEGHQGIRTRYTVLIQEGSGDAVTVGYEHGDLLIEADGHAVWVEGLDAGDLAEFASDAGDMLKQMVLAEARRLTWQLDRGAMVVEFAGWSREMVEALRDQVETLADAAQRENEKGVR